MTKGKRKLRVVFLVVCWLFNLAFAVVVVWGAWLSPFLARSFEEMDREAVLHRYFDDTYWAQVRTIEEAWPDIVSRQEVPYYYQQLIDAAQLQDETGYSGHQARLKPFAELTRKERLMLARRVPVDPDMFPLSDAADMTGKYTDWALLELLERFAHSNYGQVKSKEEQQRTILYRIGLISYKARSLRIVQREAWATRFASPISGRTIALFQDEFSPGDAYCKVLGGLEFGEVRERDSWRERYVYPARDTGSERYLYFRIYGEKEVIAEGVWRYKR